MCHSDSFGALVTLCAQLRSPDGCPWDREQTFKTLRAYIIEEAYEVVEHLDQGEPELLAGELGDLLFQIVFAAQIAAEQGSFDIDDVCQRVHAKMVRRHPHVFSDAEVTGAAEVVRNWEAIKQRERTSGGALDGVPRHLPALLKTARITEKAAARGFVRPSEDAAWQEGLEALGCPGTGGASAGSAPSGDDLARRVGDLLFAIADRARSLGVDAEAALQEANGRFAEAFGRESAP
jgi:tetrapyrrole methylase family protein / MazG family protein